MYDSCEEDIQVDLDRVARDYALMRLEYFKYTSGFNTSTLYEIVKDFYAAQNCIIKRLDQSDRFEEMKVTDNFEKILSVAKKNLAVEEITRKHLPKAPVTRLRRRLSVEQPENVSSPATPTKKKGRLAAKPQLENIDENTPVASPKPTRRRSVAKEVESAGATTTPSRRTTRHLSNTSLNLDTSVVVESPRARRAARRNSLAGSDNEVTTPVKTTRRTRKDSTSSVEGEVVSSSQVAKPVPEVIIEEPETQISSSNDENVSPNSPRKSPRLLEKKSRTSRKNISTTPELEEISKRSKAKKKTTPKDDASPTNHLEETVSNSVIQNNAIQPAHDVFNEKEQTNKSICDESQTNSDHPNKSISKQNQVTFDADECANEIKQMALKPKALTNVLNKRQRTKSWTTLTTKAAFNDSALSDTEILKNKKNRSLNLSRGHNVSGSGDGFALKKASSSNAIVITSNKLTLSSVSENENKNDVLNMMLKGKPQDMYCQVFIEDSSSDSGSKHFQDAGDQCVPVLKDEIDGLQTKSVENTPYFKNSLNDSKKNQSIPINVDDNVVSNTSCEPMEIDVTIPNNVSLVDNSIENRSASESIQSLQGKVINESNNNEDKSTLIITQIKDDSTQEDQNKSINDPNISNSDKSGVKSGQNISVISDKTTPLKPNILKTLGMKTSTPVGVSSDAKSKNKSLNKSTEESKNSNDYGDSEGGSDYDSGSEKESSNLIQNEAEDAGDDYKSGDSQDEEERRYEDENNIVERGETLTSEEDVSNDSDYEKDSFVVSSLEEDNDLLDGSGDDLGDSDNELTQSKKSKEKYNRRKEKEREYFAELARKEFASLNNSTSDDEEVSKPTKKNKRLRLSSSLLGSEDDVIIRPKKKNKLRLDSTQDDVDSPVKRKEKCYDVDKSKVEEHEITAIVEESMLQKEDPLLVKVKQEIQTPQKELDISRVNISARLPIDEVVVDENVTFALANETTDPLQEGINENDESNNSLESENQEIMNDYDTLLKGLNEKEIKDKKHNLSLDLNRKVNKKTSKTLLDQLNITQTKEDGKKSKKKSKDKVILKPQKDEDSSSDAIELNQLFPDADSDSENNELQKETEDFIPLKRVEGKTNIFDNAEQVNGSHEKAASAKKKKKDKSLLAESDQTNLSKDQVDASYVDSSLVTLFGATPKSVNSKHKKTDPTAEQPNQNQDNNETKEIHTPSKLLDISANAESSQKKKKKGKKISECIEDNSTDVTAPDSVLATNSEKKKKKKRFETATQDLEEVTTTEVELSTTKGSNKKQKKRNSETLAETADTKYFGQLKEPEIEVTTTEVELSTTKESHKKKKKKNTETLAETADTKYFEQLKEPEIEVTTKEVELSTTKESHKKQKKRISETLAETADTKYFEQLKEPEIEVTTKEVELSTTKESHKKQKKRNSETLAETADTKYFEHMKEQEIESSTKSKKRKRKSSGNAAVDSTSGTVVHVSDSKEEIQPVKKKVKLTREQDLEATAEATEHTNKKKRKMDDDGNRKPKKSKSSKEEECVFPRLPPEVLSKLDDKPRREPIKETKLISTSNFAVEETTKRKNKPSHYLEQSVYLDADSPEKKKHMKTNKLPKVLPFIPTASTSSSGFTTKFQINVIPKEVKFVAQTTNTNNFKENYLQGKNIKRMGTYELYKKQRALKLSKF